MFTTTNIIGLIILVILLVIFILLVKVARRMYKLDQKEFAKEDKSDLISLDS